MQLFVALQLSLRTETPWSFYKCVSLEDHGPFFMKVDVLGLIYRFWVALWQTKKKKKIDIAKWLKMQAKMSLVPNGVRLACTVLFQYRYVHESAMQYHAWLTSEQWILYIGLAGIRWPLWHSRNWCCVCMWVCVRVWVCDVCACVRACERTRVCTYRHVTLVWSTVWVFCC